MIQPDKVQHINIKIFAAGAQRVSVHDATVVFHRWIKAGVGPEMLIDVADYGHVVDGPGVLLIGHEANYSLDEREGRLGLVYNRKAEIEGTFASRLAQAHDAALAACDRLEREPEFAGKLKFDRNALEVWVNDRLRAPNTDETWKSLEPELVNFFSGGKIARHGEARDLFRVSVQS